MLGQSAVERSALRDRTRRHFFADCGLGWARWRWARCWAAIARAVAAGRGTTRIVAEPRPAAPPRDRRDPLAARPGHFPARARSVIYLFMAGGPSQLELFDYKPRLRDYSGRPIPDSFIQGRRFAFMDTFTREHPRLLGTTRRFARHGESGAWVSELLPNLAGVVDDLTFVKSAATDVFNHAPAKLFANTGTVQFGRPSMGSWITYGIGSESSSLPGFVVLQSGPRGPRGGAVNWSSGFLPSAYQGVPLRSGGDPILNLATPPGISPERQRRTIEAIAALNRARLDVTADPEIATRINAYEVAFRMQTSAPELIDLASETPETLKLYGVEPGRPGFATNCLLARRLVERGVRFVQLYHTEWDHHGNPGPDARQRPRPGLPRHRPPLRRADPRPEVARAAGFDAGRLGRRVRPHADGRGPRVGRPQPPHRRDDVWMAGGGTKPGITLGETDEFGFAPIADRVHIHDLQATILHLLGLDHTRLTYRFQGRDFRLTDVAGQVVTKLLA